MTRLPIGVRSPRDDPQTGDHKGWRRRLMDDVGVNDLVPLRRVRLGAEARLRVVFAELIFGGGGILCIVIAAGTTNSAASTAWAVAGCVAVVVAAFTLVPLLRPRPPGTLRLCRDGVHVWADTFLSRELCIPWSRIERVTTTAIGDGVVLDGHLNAPTFVLVLRPGSGTIPATRLSWTVLAGVLAVRSNDRWPPPSRFHEPERVGFNVDGEPDSVEELAERWDARLPRHSQHPVHRAQRRPAEGAQ